MKKTVRTPCIGVCSTGIGDEVCRGCKRFAHEVIHWNTYTDEQHQLIAKRFDTLLTQVVSAKVELWDQQRLLEQIEHQQIRYNPDQGPYCWVFDLLKAGANQISDTRVYGFSLRKGWTQHSLNELKEIIDKDYYTLSCLHYERYFKTAYVTDP